MLAPKRLKFRKKQRGHFRGVAQTCNSIEFGEFGLVAAETLWITNRQIEAARIAMTRHIKRGKGLDPNFPGYALDQEARRSADGKRQGRCRGLGVSGEARDGHVRDGGCYSGAGFRGLGFGWC